MPGDVGRVLAHCEGWIPRRVLFGMLLRDEWECGGEKGMLIQE